MPVAHGHHHARVAIAAQLGFERPGLPPGKLQNRRAAADLGIVMPHVPCAGGRNQARQGLPCNAREGKVDDVGIGEEIVEKRFDGFERIRSAKLEENDSYFVDKHPD